MDLSKLSNGEKIVGVGAIVGIVAGFLPWWSWSYDLGVFGGKSGGSIAGFTSWWSLSPVAAILALVMIALPMFGVKLPKLGVPDNVVYMILGAVTAGIAVLAMLGVGSSASYSGLGGSAGMSFGVFVAVAAGAIMLFGGFTSKGGSKATPGAGEGTGE